MPQLYSTTTTVQSILDSVARDVRGTLSSTLTPDTTILLDYTNRVSLDMLRQSRWLFLESAPQRFLTEEGQSNYYFGPSPAPFPNVQETGLNLADVRLIKQNSVFDRSNFRLLDQVTSAPDMSGLAFPDGSSRTGRPAAWKQDPTLPTVMSLYPAPDNQNLYQPTPSAPALSSTPGGALSASQYWVQVTFVDSQGNEGNGSSENVEYVPAGSLLVVSSPQITAVGSGSIGASSIGATYPSYNVYVGASSGSETLQNLSPIPVGSSWTQSGGLVAGASTPTTNSLIPLQGYIIEFTYLKLRVQLTSPSQIIQIPDEYKDILIAGVNAHAFKFLTRPIEAQDWFAHYTAGMTDIVRDTNQFLQQRQYIAPDPASVGSRFAAIETTDFGF